MLVTEIDVELNATWKQPEKKLNGAMIQSHLFHPHPREMPLVSAYGAAEGWDIEIAPTTRHSHLSPHSSS